jgi:hypothetical protein
MEMNEQVNQLRKALPQMQRPLYLSSMATQESEGTPDVTTENRNWNDLRHMSIPFGMGELVF